MKTMKKRLKLHMLSAQCVSSENGEIPEVWARVGASWKESYGGHMGPVVREARAPLAIGVAPGGPGRRAARDVRSRETRVQ